MSTLAYRRDIDGLRAVAVIAVVLFHFGVPGFTGGFVGVDVFFVISGYLITSIIWNQRQAGRFSFVEFWARRARRILPALFAMIIAVLAVGWFLLAPKDYEELGRSVRYQVLFVSNILFMRQDGYFDVASDLKPMLHTWSLAVEEQFYILFPLLLAVLSSRLKHWRLALFAILLVSFGLSVWAVSHHPEKAFFLLPMRAWELLAGAMLAVAPKHAWRLKPMAAQLLSLLGMGLILLAVFGYSKATPFPGAAALLPVLGVVLLIFANGHRETVVGQLLSSKVMVGFGLISYSWYLWHWPVFVFSSYASVEEISALDNAGLILLTLVLGYLSWKFIETPFRERRLLAGRRPILIAGALGVLVLALAGQTLRWTDGLPWRLSDQALQFARGHDWRPELMACLADDKTPDDKLFCHYGVADVPAQAMVWGDSHATALIPVFDDGAKAHDVSVILASSPGCIPVEGLEHGPVCAHFNRRIEQALKEKTVSDVVLVARWSLYLYGDANGDLGHVLRTPDGRYDRAAAEQRLAAGLRTRVAQLRASGHRVWLVKEAPLQAFSPPYRLTRLAMLDRSVEGVGQQVAVHHERQVFISQLFAELAKDPAVRVVDPAPRLCDEKGLCHAELDGYSLYTDDNHLSEVGARLVAPIMEPLFISLQGRENLGKARTNAAK
ncbi:Peptidoglycan/LPS O-acetylase OafA/YrhL, contains acyltransferase and SGNH-hydrolase domains [Pseudomonas helmanticensis]|uniref:Peptidoglycan/LPS O-acetylase OafA/YrhL, contains acyltransferase and SGNH-hydrolase domains n=1 Tax=Pseudomonas helmanticensis TaxID=1471381 RepID=A0ACD2UAJ2_9PSED|nr:acyltransferase family protein [Pseudomonas helmanticensis]SMQ28526.1 Peptidoglycan/LPS O-acetylase OafA/YrhL, contains acyltransferase and SGNH-hydrolase domains [Pseudomonas helmanticensis]